MPLPDSSSTTDSPWLSAAEPIDEAVIMPQTLAGVFDEAFDLYKRHFALLASIVAAWLIPTEILRNVVVAVWLHPLDAHLSGLGRVNPESMALLRFGQFLFGEPRSGFAGILAFLVLIPLSAPISIAVSDLYFGRTTTVRECYRRSRPYLLPMLGGYALMALIGVAVVFVGALIMSMIAGVLALFFAMAGAAEVGLVLFGTLMVLPYFAYCGIIARHYIFMTPLTVLEGLPPTYVAFRNSQLVGKKRFWRTWAAAAALPILLVSFQAILKFSLLAALEAVHLPSMVDFIATEAVSSAVHFFLAPYWTIFATLLYYDYRVRREGFDVRVLSLTTPDPSAEKGAEV
jgi:hypothetical protein